jgi:hypothetical protein
MKSKMIAILKKLGVILFLSTILIWAGLTFWNTLAYWTAMGYLNDPTQIRFRKIEDIPTFPNAQFVSRDSCQLTFKTDASERDVLSYYRAKTRSVIEHKNVPYGPGPLPYTRLAHIIHQKSGASIWTVWIPADQLTVTIELKACSGPESK